MGTRNVHHFIDDIDHIIVYYHWDGHPSVMIPEVWQPFIEELRKIGTRGFYASETAARFVSFLNEKSREWRTYEGKKPGLLSGFSVKLVSQVPGDVEFQYFLTKEGSNVTLEWQNRRGHCMGARHILENGKVVPFEKKEKR